MNTLKINGTDLSTYGIFLGSETYLDAPLIDYTAYDIPAKNGSVIQYNKRLNNVIRRFDCYIPESQNVQTAMDSLKKLLYSNVGYMKLESSYDTGTYQEGYLAQEIQVAPFNVGQSATFSLYFSCKPQKMYETSPWVYQDTTSLFSNLMFTVQPRSSGFIQAVLASLPANAVPNDMAFLVIRLKNLSSASNVTANWANHQCFWALVGTSYANPTLASHFVDLVGWDNSSLSIASATTTGSYLVLVTGVKMEGTINLARDGNTYTSGDISTKVGTVSNNNAMGCLFANNQFVFSYTPSPTTFAPDTVYRRTLLDGKVMNEATVTVRWDLMSASFLQTLESHWYSSGLGVVVIVDYDLMSAYAMGSSNYGDLDISEYVEIEGNLNGMCNEMQSATFSRSSGTYDAGAFLQDVVAPQWWKL